MTKLGRLETEERVAGVESQRAAPHLPGESGLWLFIFCEMLFFAMLFVIFQYQQGNNPQLFESSQQTLSQTHGVILTLVLLLASLFVVMACRAVERGLRRVGQRLLLCALLCGLVFSVLKVFEYHDKLAHGLTAQSNEFYMFYYSLTGLHWAHLLFGMAVLGFLYRLAGKAELSALEFAYFEGGACYWHMVDMVWIVLYTLLYLVR
jgi:nitric oxide reductase NorE protein